MNNENIPNNFSQNKDELEPKPQPINIIKQPENIIKSKEKQKLKINKIPDSNISEDDMEHPIPLPSDFNEEGLDEIKNNFYENKNKEKDKSKFKNGFILEELSLAENKKNLKANNKQTSPLQFNKVEHDSIKLKENIGKVVLNNKFRNEKNIKKNNSAKNNLLLKPEKVIVNFTLESSPCNNNKVKIKANNDSKKKIMKKNNSLNCLYKSKNNSNIMNHKEKSFNHCNKTQVHTKIIKMDKIPVNFNIKEQKVNNQINQNSESYPSLIMNKKIKININNKNISPQTSKNELKKIPMKKILKIASMDKNIKNLKKDLKTPKNSISITKKLNNNYINQIQNENSYFNTINNNNNNYNIYKHDYPYNITINQDKENFPYNNNINFNKIVINNNYNTIKNYSGNNNTINLSFENPQKIIKMISPAKLQQSIRKSNQVYLNNTNKIINNIPLPYKMNNDMAKNNNNMQLYTIPKEISNNYSSNSKTKTNSSIISSDLKITTINKINDFYNDSGKKNIQKNKIINNCNKKTIERGGKFNNISTTYVVISRNSKSKSKIKLIPKIPKPTLTIENNNITNKNRILIPNSSTSSIKTQNSNNQYICLYHSPMAQKNPTNNDGRVLKMYKSQMNLLNGKNNNNSFNLQIMYENNFSRNNYLNNSLCKENSYNSGNKKTIFQMKNKIKNSPFQSNYDYDYDYGDNKIWKNESYYSYLRNSGYNY